MGLAARDQVFEIFKNIFTRRSKTHLHTKTAIGKEG